MSLPILLGGASLYAKTLEDTYNQFKKTDKAVGAEIPQAQMGFKQEPTAKTLDPQPSKASEVVRTEFTGDRAEYAKILDQQINELYKLTQKFKGSQNRGEMWLRLAELYVEKSALLDTVVQDEYDKKLKLFQEGKLKAKPSLESAQARDLNRKAISLYEWFEKDFPQDEKIPQALFFLGYNHFELGNVQKGADYYERLVKQFPQSPFTTDARFALAEYYFENDKWAQAYSEYTPILKDRRHRLHTFATYKAAWCLYRIGKNKEALGYLEAIIKNAKSQTQGTEGAVKKIVNKSKLESESLRDIVMFYAGSGTAAKAKSYFGNLIGGDVTSYLERLAYYYSDRGDRDNAEVIFKQLIADNPLQPKAFEYQYQIVQNYYYAKNAPKFKEEMYLWVKDYGVGSKWHAQTQDKPELIANSFKLRETTLRNYVLQQHQTAQNSRAPFSQQQAQEGYELYFREFAQSAQYPDMKFYYGELLYDMGKFDEASTYYLWVAENAPQSKFYDKAAQNLIHTAEKGLPTDQEMAKRVGNSIEKISLDPRVEKFMRAAQWYMQKFPQSEKTVEIKFRVGKLYYQSNHFDEATAIFRDIVQKHPQSKYAEYSANLILDIFNLRKDIAGLEKTGNELLALPVIANSKAGNDIRGVLEKASFKKGQDLETEQKYLESAKSFDTFAAQNSQSPLKVTAFYNAGVNYERVGEYALAAGAYQKVLNSQDPSAQKLKPKAARLLAKIYQSTNQIEKSADAYVQAAKMDLNDPLAPNMLFNAAVAYESVGKTDQAVKTYSEFVKVAKVDQDKADAYYSMANIFRKSKNTPAAVENYKNYATLKQNSKSKNAEAFYWISVLSPSDQTEYRAKLISLVGSDSSPEIAKYVAKVRLANAQLTMAELKGIKFGSDANKIKSTLDRKVEVLTKLSREVSEIIKLNTAEELVDSLKLNGDAYDHLAEALREAPIPKGLKPEEQKQYRDGVDKEFVQPNKVKAREFYKKAVDRGQELEVYTESYKQAYSQISIEDNKNYPDRGEKSSDVRYIDWMSK